MSDPTVVVVADPAAAAVEAAARIVTILDDAIEVRGRADWATTGGAGPVGVYGRLVAPPLVDAVPWAAVHVWWGDDRYVPRDHPVSNVKPFDDILLGISGAEEGTAGGAHAGVPIPIENIHPFPTGETIGTGQGAAGCAAALAQELRSVGLPSVGGWPAFDLLLLGIGADGHLLSVFPGSRAFGSTELALAIPAPTHIEPHVERVTLNPAIVGAAGTVLVVATGTEKAAMIGTVFGRERDPHRWPAQLALRDAATWILDEAAASRLPGR